MMRDSDTSAVVIDDGKSLSNKKSCLQRISNGIIGVLETAFYRLGEVVALHPWLTIVACIAVCSLCGIGMIRFKETKDDAKLWVPKASRILPEKAWVDKNFPEDYRYTNVIVTADNVLSPRSINAMYDLYLESLSVQVKNNQSFGQLCIKSGRYCIVKGLLELWSYNGTVIRSLTSESILHTVNLNISRSPTFGTEFMITEVLGGIQWDHRGKIVGAQAASTTWLLQKLPQTESLALEWEKKMIDLALSYRPYLNQQYVYASRTFDDEGYGAVNADISLLTAGFSIVFIYVILVLGKFNLVEHKLILSLAGILSIGLAILFAYGLAMAFNVIYGPIHALMPFLLLGIGVDDMFVIVESWRNLSEEERQLTLQTRMALALKHAGVSITVTSVTDVVVFAIGASTVIPALSAFCIYASLGIFALYILQATFFVACLTLDQQRVEAGRDAIIICYKHKDYVANSCSQRSFLQMFFLRFYGPMLMKFPVKILVLLITLGLAGVNIWSFTKLRQDFDLYRYLPRDSYATDFVNINREYFPGSGEDAAIYCDDISYFESKDELEQMMKQVSSDPYIQQSSITYWFGGFRDWMRRSTELGIRVQLDNDSYPLTRASFDNLLMYFLMTNEGRSYSRFLKFDMHEAVPILLASYIPLRHTMQSSAADDIRAMDSLQNILDNTRFPTGKCFAYAFKYLNCETNKVLQWELYRNLILAAVCVFVVTLVLIANLWTCILVFTCVVFSVIDVVGTLQFLDVTVDTASSILIILCVGLAVDYSAHIGHTFMTIPGLKAGLICLILVMSTILLYITDRAHLTLAQIGPAVFSGGFSTFLAFVLLAKSKSYGFLLFFWVFITVVIFGLFHGLAYLPVILSWVGPSPYETRGLYEVTVPKPDADKYMGNSLEMCSNGSVTMGIDWIDSEKNDLYYYETSNCFVVDYLQIGSRLAKYRGERHPLVIQENNCDAEAESREETVSLTDVTKINTAVQEDS